MSLNIPLTIRNSKVAIFIPSWTKLVNSIGVFSNKYFTSNPNSRRTIWKQDWEPTKGVIENLDSQQPENIVTNGMGKYEWYFNSFTFEFTDIINWWALAKRNWSRSSKPSSKKYSCLSSLKCSPPLRRSGPNFPPWSLQTNSILDNYNSTLILSRELGEEAFNKVEINLVTNRLFLWKTEKKVQQTQTKADSTLAKPSGAKEQGWLSPSRIYNNQWHKNPPNIHLPKTLAKKNKKILWVPLVSQLKPYCQLYNVCSKTLLKTKTGYKE